MAWYRSILISQPCSMPLPAGRLVAALVLGFAGAWLAGTRRRPLVFGQPREKCSGDHAAHQGTRRRSSVFEQRLLLRLIAAADFPLDLRVAFAVFTGFTIRGCLLWFCVL